MLVKARVRGRACRGFAGAGLVRSGLLSVHGAKSGARAAAAAATRPRPRFCCVRFVSGSYVWLCGVGLISARARDFIEVGARRGLWASRGKPQILFDDLRRWSALVFSIYLAVQPQGVCKTLGRA